MGKAILNTPLEPDGVGLCHLPNLADRSFLHTCALHVTVAKRAKSFFFGHEESEFSAAKFSSSFEWVTVGHSVAHSDNFLCAQGLAQRARTMHRSKIPFVERTLVTIVQLQRLTLPGSSPNRA